MPEPKHALETGENISTIYDSVYEQMHTDHARNLLKLERKLGLSLSILLCQVICTPIAAAEKKNHAEYPRMK